MPWTNFRYQDEIRAELSSLEVVAGVPRICSAVKQYGQTQPKQLLGSPRPCLSFVLKQGDMRYLWLLYCLQWLVNMVLCMDEILAEFSTLGA
jgi:hypothetical protein